MLVLRDALDSTPVRPRLLSVAILIQSLPSLGSTALVSYATIFAVAPDEAVASIPIYAPATGTQNAEVPSLPTKNFVSLS